MPESNGLSAGLCLARPNGRQKPRIHQNEFTSSYQVDAPNRLEVGTEVIHAYGAPYCCDKMDTVAAPTGKRRRSKAISESEQHTILLAAAPIRLLALHNSIGLQLDF